jgi:hypothetical protein
MRIYTSAGTAADPQDTKTRLHIIFWNAFAFFISLRCRRCHITPCLTTLHFDRYIIIIIGHRPQLHYDYIIIIRPYSHVQRAYGWANVRRKVLSNESVKIIVPLHLRFNVISHNAPIPIGVHV